MHTEEFYLDPVRYDGRPAKQREDRETACYALLERLEIPFVRVDHSPAMTIELCHRVEQLLDTKICKNLFLCNRQGTEHYLLLMPGDKPFKTKYLSAQLGCTRLSFASETALMEMLGLCPGSATVFGLMQSTSDRVHLVIDRALLCETDFACHPCFNTSTVSFSTQHLLQRVLPALGVTPTFVDLPEVSDG